MDINQMEAAYARIIEGINIEFANITRDFNITGLSLLFMDNIKYRVYYNKDLPYDVFDLRVKIVDENGAAKIEKAELAVMTEKIEAYIKCNEGLSIKLRNKFRFVLRFEIGHYLYMKKFEDDKAPYSDFEAAMNRYEDDLNGFNDLCRTSSFSTRERITRYCEIPFNAWSAEKVGLTAETMIEFDNNIVIP
ncbi:MAG: hypothetical protein FWE74_10015 [Oscillospiraceae bacterium]|nr:hypothetical protein [Oscillospiraceae bacterium]